MNIKKLTLLLFAFIFFGLCTSCTKENIEPISEGPFVGTWKVIEKPIFFPGQSLEVDPEQIKVTLSNESSFFYVDYILEQDGRDTKVMRYNDNLKDYFEYFDFQIHGDFLYGEMYHSRLHDSRLVLQRVL